MMNWNNNDTKYILKRIITYFLISAIIFFIGQRCVRAETVAPVGNMEYWLTNGTVQPKSKSSATFYGETFYHSTDSSIQPINGVFAGLNNTVSGQYFAFSMLRGQPVPTLTARIQFSDGSWTSCDIMNEIKDYADGTMYSAVCNLSGSGNKIVYKYGFIWSDSAGYNASYNSIYMSKFNVFENAQGIINYTQSLNAIQNRMEANTAETIDAINAATGVINQDYNQQTGTNYLNVFNNLFTQEDENVIRQFVMIPFNLYILLYNSITNGSCQSISLGTLYGVNLELPCINYRNIIGVPLYTTIDTIFGACLLFGIIRMIKKFFNSLFTVSSKATDENGIEVFK